MNGPNDRFEEKRAVFEGTAVSIATTAGVGMVGYALAPRDWIYGTWLFALLPIVCGVVSCLVASRGTSQPASLGFRIGLWSYLFSALAVILVQVEGLICAAMAAPVYLLFFWVGYFLTYAALEWFEERGRGAMTTLVPVMTCGIWISAKAIPDAAMRTQTTLLDIAAPPEKIWPHLFEMKDVPPPRSLLAAVPFRAGVARPLEITAAGRRVGDARHCRLSTGDMPETITIIEPERRLEFRVDGVPPAMRELNPFGEVDAPHLRGYFAPQVGEFRLIPLPGGRTRLVGTSTYALRIYPAPYWALWSDAIVDGVHRSVMEEIKRRVE